MSVRLFVALPLEPAVREDLGGWAASVAAPAGWRPIVPQNLHVTLVFVGAAPEERVDEVAAAMRETFAGVPPVVARPAGARRLGGVLAATLQPEDAAAIEPLAAAQAGLARRLDRVENRPWLPHVTLARARGRARPPMVDAPLPEVRVHLDEVALFASQLHPSGARYRVLHAVPFEPAPLASDAERDP